MFTNHDYEPYAKQRDKAIEELLIANGASLHTYKDQVILEKGEVLKDDGKALHCIYPLLKKMESSAHGFSFEILSG